jgi:hypothetical protein
MATPNLEVQLLFAAEVVVDGRDIAPGGSGKVADAGTFEASLGKKLFRRGK